MPREPRPKLPYRPFSFVCIGCEAGRHDLCTELGPPDSINTACFCACQDDEL